jgi:hypothetical protein
MAIRIALSALLKTHRENNINCCMHRKKNGQDVGKSNRVHTAANKWSKLVYILQKRMEREINTLFHRIAFYIEPPAVLPLSLVGFANILLGYKS